MTQIQAEPPVIDYRGLVLKAHYNFRKEAPSRSGEAKGQGTLAAERFRASQSKSDFQSVVYNIKLLGRVGEMVDLVGPPSEVPYNGLTQFLLTKQLQLHEAYTLAFQEMVAVTAQAAQIAPTIDPRADAMQGVAISQGLVDAHLHVLQCFHHHFGPVLRELNGR